MEETRQKLAATEKELKSSAVMNLELEDYQRSMRSLEEQLSSRQDELERVRKEGQLQQDSMVQLKKELGKCGLTQCSTCLQLIKYFHLHVHVHVDVHVGVLPVHYTVHVLNNTTFCISHLMAYLSTLYFTLSPMIGSKSESI